MLSLLAIVLLSSLIYFSQEVLLEISRRTHRNLTEILTHSHNKINPQIHAIAKSSLVSRGDWEDLNFLDFFKSIMFLYNWKKHTVFFSTIVVTKHKHYCCFHNNHSCICGYHSYNNNNNNNNNITTTTTTRRSIMY